MKETRFYHKALNLSLLDGKAVKAALDEQIAREPAKRREPVSFPENNPAAADVVSHHGLAVTPCIFDPSPPKRLIKTVVCISGEDPNAYSAVFTEKACSHVFPVFGSRIDEASVIQV